MQRNLLEWFWTGPMQYMEVGFGPHPRMLNGHFIIQKGKLLAPPTKQPPISAQYILLVTGWIQGCNST